MGALASPRPRLRHGAHAVRGPRAVRAARPGRATRGAQFLVLLAALAVAGPARAAGWSATAVFDRATCSPADRCVTEPAPRVAVNAKGQAVAAWIDTQDRARVAVAARPGRFGAAVTLGKSGLRPSPAIAPDGTVTVVWEQHEALVFARARDGKFGPAQPLAPKTKREDGDAHAAAQADGSVAVVYESNGDIRAVTLSPQGVPAAPVTLGQGGFGHNSVRAAADGTLTACCITPVNNDPNVPPDLAPKVAVHRGAWKLVSAPDLGEDGEIETVFANAQQLILGVIDVRSSGDASSSGIPGFSLDGAVPVFARVSKPTRGLAPDVAIDGSGRSVLVYGEKTGPKAFSREAPVYASIAGGPGRRLTSAQGYEPTVRPLGPGAIAVWQLPGAKWGVAVERDGAFRTVAAPRGPGPRRYLGEDFHYAYDLAANGTRAVLTWVAADGSIRVSERS